MGGDGGLVVATMGVKVDADVVVADGGVSSHGSSSRSHSALMTSGWRWNDDDLSDAFDTGGEGCPKSVLNPRCACEVDNAFTRCSILLSSFSSCAARLLNVSHRVDAWWYDSSHAFTTVRSNSIGPKRTDNDQRDCQYIFEYINAVQVSQERYCNT